MISLVKISLVYELKFYSEIIFNDHSTLLNLLNSYFFLVRNITELADKTGSDVKASVLVFREKTSF
jgi:hypothetical protein